jgi:hypothetical protein
VHRLDKPVLVRDRVRVRARVRVRVRVRVRALFGSACIASKSLFVDNK